MAMTSMPSWAGFMSLRWCARTAPRPCPPPFRRPHPFTRKDDDALKAFEMQISIGRTRRSLRSALNLLEHRLAIGFEVDRLLGRRHHPAQHRLKVAKRHRLVVGIEGRLIEQVAELSAIFKMRM